MIKQRFLWSLPVGVIATADPKYGAMHCGIGLIAPHEAGA